MSTICAERPAADRPPATPAGRYRLDPASCDLEVSVRFGLVTVRGRFTDATGTLDLAEQPAASRVAVRVTTASLTSGSATMDGLLHGAKLIDPERNPELEFTAEELTCAGCGAGDGSGSGVSGSGSGGSGSGSGGDGAGSTVTGTLRTATGSLPLTLQVAAGDVDAEGALRVTAAGSLRTAEAVGLLSVPGVERVLGRTMTLRLTVRARPVAERAAA